MTISVLIITLLTFESPSPIPAKHKSLPEISVENCWYLKKATDEKRKKALAVAKAIYNVEEAQKIPDQMRGMSLAAACLESAFNPKALGDRRFSKSKKKPMAVGAFQLWPWYERAYDVDRTDPVSSASAWLRHIKRQVPGIKRKCKHRTLKKVWVAAWVTGIRYKKPAGRCNERPKHYKFFRKIRKIYEAQTSKSLTILGK